MVNNSTNINKTNNHLSLSLTEHTKKTKTYDLGNLGPGLGQTLFYKNVHISIIISMLLCVR